MAPAAHAVVSSFSASTPRPTALRLRTSALPSSLAPRRSLNITGDAQNGFLLAAIAPYLLATRPAGFRLAGMPVGPCGCQPGAVELRCLIVDDSPQFAAAASRLLELQGVQVVGVAATGAEAAARASALRPDVALVDIGLREESGFDVAALLSRIPVILISARDEDDLGRPVTASPAVGFLPKSGLSGAAIRRLLSGLAGT
jgi:CheY-like chemotaxis protein